MPSRPQGRMNVDIKRLGIIAGAGRLPALLLDHCHRAGIQPFIIALKGQADPALYAGREHVVLRLGAAGDLFRALRTRHLTDVVMIGAVKKPSLLDLRPDLYAARFLARVGFSTLGDNSLLSAIKQQMGREGITVHGAHRFLPDILMTEGLIGGPPPDTNQLRDIDVGIAASQKIGHEDIGQSVIVRSGNVIGEEGPDGTDALIQAHGAAGAILVKTCKPQQDRDIDLPTIGPDTVDACVARGMAGIALQVGSAFIVDRDAVRDRAQAHGIFVIGIAVAAEHAHAG